jgi:hypothetical protein
MNPLAQAIDAVLEFVAEHPQISQAGIYNRHDDRNDWRDYREELLHRCRAVRGEAHKAGLLDLQPGQGRFLAADVKFLGWCNVPGVYINPPNRPTTLVFGPVEVFDEWREEMLALRAAAEPPPVRDRRKGGRPKSGEKGCDAAVRDLYRKIPNAKEWGKKAISEATGFGRSAVGKCDAYNEPATKVKRYEARRKHATARTLRKKKTGRR